MRNVFSRRTHKKCLCKFEIRRASIITNGRKLFSSMPVTHNNYTIEMGHIWNKRTAKLKLLELSFLSKHTLFSSCCLLVWSCSFIRCMSSRSPSVSALWTSPASAKSGCFVLMYASSIPTRFSTWLRSNRLSYHFLHWKVTMYTVTDVRRYLLLILSLSFATF